MRRLGGIFGLAVCHADQRYGETYLFVSQCWLMWLSYIVGIVFFLSQRGVGGAQLRARMFEVVRDFELSPKTEPSSNGSVVGHY